MKVRFKIKNLSKTYKKKENILSVIENLNLEIYDSTVNAIVGGSGEGKSTLGRILMRIENFDKGEIIYKDINIKEYDIYKFRFENQIVFQNPFEGVNPYFKIKKIIEEPMIVKGFDKTERKQRIKELMDLIELPLNILDRKPHEVSGGQLQRIVLARALSIDPEFLILDEPFSSLDKITAEELIIEFKKIFQQLKIGVFYISHNIERVFYLSDYINILKNKKIILSKKTNELTKSQVIEKINT